MSRLAIFSFGLGTTVALVPASAQTLANGSFEQSGGSFTGWSTIGSTSIANITNTQPSLTPTNGSFQAFISNNGSGAVAVNNTLDSFFNVNNIALPADTLNRVPTNGSGILQTFSVSGASVLSFDVKSVTAEVPNSQWDIMFYIVDGKITVLPNPDATGANPNNSFGVTVSTNSGPDSYTYGYNYQTITVALAAGTHTIGFGVYNTGDQDVNSGLFIDNVTVVPEPATYALLGGGLVFLALGRWRRCARLQTRA